jgi:hypothetical protein
VEGLQTLWVIVYFVLAFVLIFTWSKVNIINKKLDIISALVGRMQGLSHKEDQEEETHEPSR